jgi:hypothetical protein
MTSLEVKILISLAAVSLVYAFICQIRLSQKAGKLADRVKEKCPDLWSELNPIARNINGGYAGLKLLYQKNTAAFTQLDQEYRKLQSIERHLLGGIITGFISIGFVLVGVTFWGWKV